MTTPSTKPILTETTTSEELAPAWKRYPSIYLTLARNSLAREMSFKSNFLLWIFVEVMWFALQLSFISVIYLHTENIGTWTKWQVVLLVGASHFIQQVFQAFFLVNCTNLSELVRTGKMDFLMLLPVNTRFISSMRQLDLGAFFNAAGALCVMTYAMHKLGYVPAIGQVLGFLGLSAAGILIHYSLMFLLATISFYTVRAQGIVWGYYNLFNIARLPDDAFVKQRVFKAVFTYALPMLLVSNIPVRVLSGKLTDARMIGLLLGMCVVCFFISEWGWRVSLKRYTSASS